MAFALFKKSEDQYINFRKVKVNNYIVFYKVEEKNRIVEIVRIMYARRNWTKIL